MRVKIRLDTMRDINNFVHTCSTIPAAVYITDGNDLKVSGKSLLGAMYAMEFKDLWCECVIDIYHDIKDFVIID